MFDLLVNGPASRSQIWATFGVWFVIYSLTTITGMGVLGILFTALPLMSLFAACGRHIEIRGNSFWWCLIGFIPFALICMVLYYGISKTPHIE